MSHLRRWVTLALGLLVGGCALLPHMTKAPTQLAGPVQLRIMGLPDEGRQTQASTVGTTGLVVAASRMIEIKAYLASDTYSLASNGGALDSTESGLSVSTSSVATGATSATVNMPAMAGGDHVLQINLYKSTKRMSDAGTGADLDHARYYLIAQGEVRVTAIVGVPTTATARLYQTVSGPNTLDCRVPGTTATTSVILSGLTGTSGLYLRMANFNPFQMLWSGAEVANQHKVRVGIVSPTAYSWTVASGSTAAGDFSLGSVLAAQGFATGSFSIPSEAGTSKIWNWGSTDRKVIYTDVDLTTLDASYQNLYTNPADPYGAALTLYLPAALCPTGFKVYLTDRGSNVAAAGSTGTFR